MKQVLSAILIILLAASVHAQKTSSHLEISLNGGIASPLGSFGKGDYADDKSGYSKTGGHFNIAAVYFINKRFGIAVSGGYSQFKFKGAQSLADGYKEDSGTDSTTLFTKGHNRNFSVLIGPYYSIPVSKKLSVDLRVLGGYINTHLAGFEIHYEDYTDNIMMQNEASKSAFGFQAGAGVTYHITDKIGIKANADYFSSKPKMNISYDNFVVNSGRRLTTYNESLDGINTTLGIAFSFGK